MGKGIASVRLLDGTVITTDFQDNSDGKVDPDEVTRAQNRLIEKMGDKYKLTGRVDISSEIQIVESGKKEGVVAKGYGAGGLVNNNVVKLFGSPPTKSAKAPEGSQDWVAVGTMTDNGKTYTIYHEMNSWEPGEGDKIGREARGRIVRVAPDGTVEKNESDARSSQWFRLKDLPDYMTSGIPNKLPYLKESEIPSKEGPQVTPVSWKVRGNDPEGQYQYYEGPGGSYARRSLKNQNDVQVLEELADGQGGTTKVWRTADKADAVPDLFEIATVGTQTVAVRKTKTAEDQGKTYDYYAGIDLATNGPVILRRTAGDPSAPWEIMGKDGFGPATPMAPEKPAKENLHRHRKQGHRSPKPTQTRVWR